MPTLIDVLTLGLSAGLSFDASLSLYCDRYQTELSQAFSEAMLSWRMGVTSREEALEAMACELGVDALARFATVVGESLDFGSPLASALEVQAKAIRDEQRAQVEEEIEKAPVKMLIPWASWLCRPCFSRFWGRCLPRRPRLEGRRRCEGKGSVT